MKILLGFAIYVSLMTDIYAFTKGKTYKLTILHTNDHHGQFWENSKGEFGMAARATLIKKLREEIQAEGGHVLLLDAGDVNTGVPQSDLQDAEPDFRGMSLMGYDVMAVGNHEFDKGVPTLKKQRHWAGFPFVSANIYIKNSNRRLFPSHVVKEVEDLKVTIFGLTTEDTPVKSNPKHTAHLRFVPVVEEAKKIVPRLRKESDVLIALTHIGHYVDEKHAPNAPGDVTVARSVKGIDVIVGGHTNSKLEKPDIQNGTIIVQANHWGKYVGRLDLEFRDGKLTMKNSQLIPVNLAGSEAKIAPDADMLSLLTPFKQKGDEDIQVEIGQVDQDLNGETASVRNEETNMGNLVALAYKEKLKADVGLSNSGGIRASISAGPITIESVLRVLPFGGNLGTVEMTGQELKDYLEHLIFKYPPGQALGGYPQISGVDICASKPLGKIIKMLVNGEILDLTRKYTLALTAFSAGGGDGYPKLNFKDYGFVDADALKEFILARKSLKASDYAPRGYVKFED